jgi:uncharacterized protein (TIGR02270 family)
MTNLAASPVLLDIYEEHLDEAAWLWREWEACLDSPIYTLRDAAKGPEERLLAHLDALVLGGDPVAQALLIPALASEHKPTVTAAAWALIQAEDADQQDAVFAALSATEEPTIRAAIARALCLASRADLSRLLPLWQTGDPHAQALVLDIFAPREPDWVRERLEPALRGGHPALVAAALRAIRRFKDKFFFNHVQAATRSQEPTILLEAITAGLALGVREAWDACRVGIELDGRECRLPLGILATSADAKDRERVRSKVSDPKAGLHALWALGFTGDLESVEILLQKLSDEKAAKVACDSFCFITGLVCEGDLVKPGEAKGPEEVEVGDDDPPPVVLPSDFLPDPKPDAINTWWANTKGRFRAGARYLYGQTRTPDTLRAALTRAATWRQEVVLLELVNTKIGAPQVELKTWAREQLKQVASIAGAS